MSTSSTCGLCVAEHSWQHSLLHCTVARCVWALENAELVEALNNNTEPDAKRWLFALIDMLPATDFIQVALTLWALWFSRRQALYEEIFQSPLATHHFIKRYIREMEDCKSKRSSAPNGQNQQQPSLGWIPPPLGSVKIRVDGAVSRSQNEGSFSAVCRDASGLYLGSSAIRVRDITDPPTLEALACREALALAQDLGVAHVIIASDCQGVIKDIHKQEGGMYASIIREIGHTARTINDCTFIFEGRASDHEAHSLAKHAFGLDFGRYVWLINPPDIHCIPMNLFE